MRESNKYNIKSQSKLAFEYFKYNCYHRLFYRTELLKTSNPFVWELRRLDNFLEQLFSFAN